MFPRLAPLVLLLAGCPGGTTSRAEGAAEEGAAEEKERDVPALAREGRTLFFGRAGCLECHKVGGEGTKVRGPNLGAGDDFAEPVAERARERRPELRPIEYVVESILDPDAYVVEGYARGVMKPPDEPPIALTNDEVMALAVFLAGERVGAKDLGAARARIPEARRARERRAQSDWADELIGRVRWDQGDRSRGQRLFERFGCGGCHGNPRNPIDAPALDEVGARLSREDLARWIIAPPKTRMPSYDLYVQADDLGDLATFLLSR